MSELDSKTKNRKALRTTFSKTANGLKQHLDAESQNVDEINGTWDLLQSKFEELGVLDAEIFELLLTTATEEELVVEIERRDEYFKKFSTLRAYVDRIKANAAQEVRSVELQSDAGTSNSKAGGVISGKRKFKLPRIEFKPYDGSIKGWLAFWAQFKKIHEDVSIDDNDKIEYLLQITVPGSRVRQLVESYPAMSENYIKIIESMQSRFGREDIQIEFYVRELLKLVLTNTTSKQKCDLAKLYDCIETHLRALETLGITSEKCAAILFPLIESCLPYELLQVWQRSTTFDETACVTSVNDKTIVSSLETRLKRLIIFLRHEVENEQRASLVAEGFGLVDRETTQASNSNKGLGIGKLSQKKISVCPTATDLVNCETIPKAVICIFCEGSHNSDNCFKAQKMTPWQKRSILGSKKACFRCLKSGHHTNRCRVRLSCVVCSRSHVAIMCPDIPVKKLEAKTSNKADNGPEISRDQTLTNQSNTHVFLQTLRVTVVGAKNLRTVRALIDSGSQRTYILKDTATRLGLQPKRQEKINHCLFGGSEMVSTHQCYEVTVKYRNFSLTFEALDQPNICSDVAAVLQGPWTEETNIFNIEISDINQPGPIELLLGADIIASLYTGNRRQLACGLVATETFLGWTLMGKISTKIPRSDRVSTTLNLLIKNSSISDLWELEAIGIQSPVDKRSKEDTANAARELFRQTVSVDRDGRYIVRLPWLEGHPPLPDNYSVAQKRLISTIRNLKNQGLFNQYQGIFDEWTAEGIIERVSRYYSDVEPCHYLPHRPVVKDSSLTTKIRPVFDASAHEKEKPSLNHCLEKGPNLIELIPSMLLRFRENKIGVIADIKKAFLQIGVHEKDRDYLRFLWVDSKGEEIAFRHRRVVFGINSSPFLLGATLEYHLSRGLDKVHEKEAYSQETLEKLQRSFYVDNCVTSLTDNDSATRFIRESIAVMNEARLELRGWERTQELTSVEKTDPCPVLGVKWCPWKDVLTINFKFLEDDLDSETVVTKRQILSTTQRIFDPIGYLCPILLLPKLLLQKLWSEKITWDQPVDYLTEQTFRSWLTDLPQLEKVEIPRWIMAGDIKLHHLSLHTFCDASKDAYACVVFLRVQRQEMVKVFLLAAKARVAPIKKPDSKMTIPRLELLAATIGARLYDQVRRNLQGPMDCFFWSDSSTVVSWIQRREEWSVFVWNRVVEIRSLTPAENWHHLPGTHNPADLPSRGCHPKQLLSSRWWEGPTWLYQTLETWPSVCMNCNEDEISAERKKNLIVTLTNLETRESMEFWHLEYFSNFNKIIRMIAWILRFIYNCRHPQDKHRRELTALEHDMAEKFVFKLVQERGFSEKEIRILNGVNPHRDADGLLRIKSRVSARKDTNDFRFPIVLPSKHHVVRCLIMDAHIKACHAGTQNLLGLLRERFWIMSSRRTVRSALTKCYRCKRYTVKPMYVEPPPLPLNRVRDAIVFEVTGVDFAGPLYLKNGTKAWICLFTCAVFRAVHLEVTTSLSTPCFLQALRRFVSRRGRPKTIYSDNGTNFHGAENAISKLNWDSIVRETSIQRIDWRFNPPTAAWWGGFWERLIGVIKRLLRRVLGRASLDYEDLLTLTCECEAVVNARPLTYLSEDLSDLVALSPVMFLTDQTEFGLPDYDAVDNVSLCRKVRKIQSLRETLRARFRAEYIGQLKLLCVKKQNRTINIDDLVLVGDDNHKRLDWPLGRVIEILPGKDGLTRVVKVITSQGQLLRPVQRLFPLECCTAPEFGYEQKTVTGSVGKEAELDPDDGAESDSTESVYAKQGETKVTCSGRVVKVPSRYL